MILGLYFVSVAAFAFYKMNESSKDRQSWKKYTFNEKC